MSSDRGISGLCASMDGAPSLPLPSAPADAVYRQVVQSIPAAIYTTDASGVIQMFNEAAVALWGRRPEPGALWCGSWRIFRTDGSPMPLSECPMAIALREAKPVSGHEIVVERPDGTRRHVLPHPRPLYDDDGVMIGAVNLLVDITDRKHAEAALDSKDQELRFVTRTTPLMLVRCSRDCRYQFVNRAAASIFGLTPEDLIGKRIPEVMGEAAFAVVKPRIELALQGQEVEFEAEVPYPTGVRWMHVNYVPDRDSKGEVVGWLASIVDVTDRRRTEEALRISEERYRAVVEAQSEMVCRFRPDGTILFVNKAYARARASSAKSLIGTDLYEAVPESERERIREAVRRLSPVTPEIRIENRFETAGGPRWTLWTNRAIAFDPDGHPTEVQSAGIDITDRKRAEEALVQREQYLRAVIETSPECVKVISADGTLEYMNPAGLEMVEADSPEAVQGKKVFDLIAPEHRDLFREFHARVCGGARASLEFDIVGLRGTRRHMQTNAMPLRGPDNRLTQVALTRDITAHRKAASASAYLAAIVQSTEDAIVSKTLDGIITSWNGGAERIFGYTAAEAVGRPIELIIPKELRNEEKKILQRLRAGERIEHFDTVRVAKDGRELQISLTISPIKDGSGRIVGASKVARDVTERKRSEQALRESDRRLHLALEAGRMGTWEWSIERETLILSPGLEAIYGLAPGSFPGTVEALERLTHPDDLTVVRVALLQTRSLGIAHHIEFRIVRPDHQTRWLEGRGTAIKSATGEVVGVVGVLADVTQRKHAELELARQQAELERRVEERTKELGEINQRLRMSERMAMMGTLSAGLGHDMGNLLVPIRIRLESLADGVQSDQGREDLAAIRTSVEYLRRLANGLRLISMDPTPSQAGAQTDLTAWWADAQGVFGSVLPRGITLKSEIPSPGCPPVGMAKAPLTQVVFNLIQNAGDAMKSRGAGQVTVSVRVSEASVFLSVTDDGPGMTPEVLARCMEPYFTTKTRGISTGLGLSLVYGLVRDAGGSVEVSSEVGKGTSFTLRLPIGVASDPEPDVTCPVAVVQVKDARLRAFLNSELKFLRFAVPGSADGPASLYVLDDEGHLCDIPCGARVIFLGDRDATSGGDSVRVLGPKPGIWKIRDALREAASSLATPSGTGPKST
jgi:PAS domain S-box-containing protein